MSPGDLLSVGGLRVGQLVEGWSAHDGRWFAAKVMSLDGEGADAAAMLNFIGYGPRWNEKKKDEDGAICARLSSEERILANMPARVKEKLHLRNPDGTWQVGQVLGKRKHRGRIEYLVRWKVCPLPSACLRLPAPACARATDRHSGARFECAGEPTSLTLT